MSITINHNAMANNAYRNLSNTYSKLSTSVQRMSSGLRINSAADDAAGLAIREMMRSDISTTQQGIRNAADAISMIQTADGALGIIDEKLTRMKELAEQASTATYTTAQRDIINSEYQAMAAEIDRIANATNFNGIKLLDGSVSNQHGGQGLKIHFGVSNKDSEDYYFINIGDARATSSTGLRVGGDAKNDIWGQGAAASGPLAGPGCCTAGFSSLNGNAGFTSGDTFAFGYNWDWTEDTDTNLLSGKYLAGRYTVGASDSLQDLVDKVNDGSQSRVGIRIDEATLNAAVTSGGSMAICIGNEAYAFGDSEIIQGGQITKDYQTYNYSAETYTGMGGGTKLWASKTVADQMNGIASAMTKVSLDTEVEGATPTNQAVMEAVNASINKKAAQMDGSYQVTSKAAALSAATTSMVSDSTLLALASGVTSTVQINGIWGDGANWTDDEAIAKSLGWNTPLSVSISATDITDSMTAAERREVINEKLADATGGNQFDLSTKKTTTEGALAVLGGNQTNMDFIGDPVASTKNVTAGGVVDSTKTVTYVTAGYSAEDVATAINENTDSDYWAMTEGSDMLYVFAKDGGDLHNVDKACDIGGSDSQSKKGRGAVTFENVEGGTWHEEGTSLTLGGQDWGKLTPVQSKTDKGNEVWNVTLSGRDVGKERDLWIANNGDLITPGLEDSQMINGMDRDNFLEVQNAADANWAAAEVRTQSSAQEALDALSDAITKKDKIRADLGAMQNRLENTMSNLEIQAENLQASESRISDVDVAKEMTEFTKNNVMTQAATSMLAQANSMSQLALSLMG